MANVNYPKHYRCHVCGAKFNDCRYPVAHNLPTINNVGYAPHIHTTNPKEYTARELDILNNWQP